MATPTNKYKLKNEAQIRALTLSPAVEGAKRFDTPCYVEGLAARFDKYLLWEDDGWKMYERFERSCFDETDMSDVIFQYDHSGRVYARTSNNTLIVEATDEGLYMAADLNKTDGARGLYADIDAGMITKMSWRFKVGKYAIERDEENREITFVHQSIPKIYDVSAVSIPANNDTEISARSYFDGVIEEEARREAELDDKRRKLKIKIKLNQ